MSIKSHFFAFCFNLRVRFSCFLLEIVAIYCSIRTFHKHIILMSSLLDENAIFLQKQLESLYPLVEDLKKRLSIFEKLEVLNGFPRVKNFFNKPGFIHSILVGRPPEAELVIKSVIAIGQADRVFYIPPDIHGPHQKLKELLDTLLPVEKFYTEMGGIVGYHLLMLQFLSSLRELKKDFNHVEYHRAEGVDIAQKNTEVRNAVLWGLKRMDQMAEIYPVGGAADRLKLQDEKTGLALPAAKLLFCGRTLLEGLITDLQAREYLHYKLFGRQILTPVAMMTSQEKDNHCQVLSICEEKQWFGRPKEAFRFFCQSAVPTVNKQGDWCLQSPMQLLLKPGGHGVIWKLARDEGIFEWLFSLGRKKALVRQINNPLAGCDDGLIAFVGLGCRSDKIFGFASCPREIKASEGVNVLVEKKLDRGSEFILTNIEYCDFKKFNIPDEPAEEGSNYSKFSSNTNILFVDLKAVEDAVCACPLPGMLVNLKASSFKDERGDVQEEEIARLESTMQNIADFFGERFDAPLNTSQKLGLRTFLTYNERRKTISTVKKEYVPGSSLLETPEGCFTDILHNARDLLVHHCHFQVPELSDGIAEAPPFLFFYHPSLGPLYGIIAQKLRAGRMGQGSELQLEIAEADIENLDLDGSLCIQAEQVMGHSENGIQQYSAFCGKCVLKNVKVRNQGIDAKAPNIFWKNEIFRKEACRILIQGDGEFYAEDVSLEGDLRIDVPAGTRVTAYDEKGELKWKSERIDRPSWSWKYHVDDADQILLSKD